MSEHGTRLSVRLTAVTIPVVLVLVVLEVVLRVTGFASPDHRMVYAGSVVKGRPGAVYVNQREHRNVVRLNNFGFHDRDWIVGESEPTILFLGDSMVEGIQVPVDSLFTSVLEDELRADGENIDVMNAGVSATGTGHQYLLWKTFIHDSGVRVDHVVLCVFPQNDLKDNNAELGRGPEDYGVYLGPDGEVFVCRSGGSSLRSVVRKLIDHSALLNLVYTRLHYLRSGARPGEEEGGTFAADAGEHPDLAAAGSDSLWAESLRRTLALIERWDREAEREGEEFSVVIIPNVDWNNFYEDELGRTLEEEGRSGRLDVLRLTLGGRDPLETDSFDGRTLGHFNCRGHKLVARELRAWLESRGGGGT